MALPAGACSALKGGRDLYGKRAVGNFVRTPHRVASREMISKLIKAGYLKPTQRNNADAITEAIARMKRDLRDTMPRPGDKNGDQKAT